MKYNKLDLGTVEAIVNKLGGIEGVKTFLSGRTGIVNLKPWRTVEVDGKKLNLVKLNVGDLAAASEFPQDIYEAAQDLRLGVCPNGTAEAVFEQGDLELDFQDDRQIQFATALTGEIARFNQQAPRIAKRSDGGIYMETFTNGRNHGRGDDEKFVFVLR